MESERLAHLTRRRFLTGAGVLAGAVALGACGGDDDPDDADEARSTTTDGSKGSTSSTGAGGTTTTEGSGATGEVILANFFGTGQFAAGSPIRAPFSIADRQGVLTPELAPPEITVGIYDIADRRILDPITVKRRSAGLPRPYFALETTIAQPGNYLIKAEGGPAAGETMAIEILDPKDLQVVRAGQAMPAVETPTPANGLGVNPICTRTPAACPLHDVSLAAALKEKRPVALVVASPYFCKVAICGPVLDLVLGAVAAHPKVRFVHAEVYSDPYNDPQLVKYAPILAQLKLPLEPVLYLVGSDGIVRQRLDSIFDTEELGAALRALR